MYERDLFDEKTWTPPSNLPDLSQEKIIAIDTETMGLNINRDRLCLVQLSRGDGNAHLIQISKKSLNKQDNFPNLKKIFSDPNTTKLFHFARFDLAVIEKNICILNGPLYCTKIASKLSRTFGAKHGLANNFGRRNGLHEK